jgi:hypothetical protein
MFLLIPHPHYPIKKCESSHYETCEKYLGRRRGQQPGFSLKDYIEVAKHQGLVSEELAKEAHMIRERANKVLHNDPRLTEKTQESITGTVRILYMIETGEPERYFACSAVISMGSTCCNRPANDIFFVCGGEG